MRAFDIAPAKAGLHTYFDCLFVVLKISEGLVDPVNGMYNISSDSAIIFDPAKNARNIIQRGLSFVRASEFDFETAVFLTDNRENYDEIRHVAVGYLDGRLHVLCFVRKENHIRVISFRKANTREANRYGKPLTIDG